VLPAENAAADSTSMESDSGKRKRVRQIATPTDSTPPTGGDKYEEEQAADRAADARLNEQLRICRNC
jgi:hypothetical protein